MTIADAIFDNLMTMMKEVTAYDHSIDPDNKKKLIEMFSHIHNTIGYFDWGANSCTLANSIEEMTREFEDAYNEQHSDTDESIM
jgi:hypothetical protein